MYYDEEVYESEIEIFPSLSASSQGQTHSPSIIVINGDSPALQNKVALELQNLFAKKFIHINIYQKLVGQNSVSQLNSGNLSQAVATIHEEIITLANNGNNIIISHNTIFASEQSHLYNSLKRFSPYWVDLKEDKHPKTFQNLKLNITEQSTIQTAFMIYSSHNTFVQASK